jgi:CheY-like chemotaxis protein
MALAATREQLKGFLRAGIGPAARTCLAELAQTIQLLGNHASIAGFQRMAQMVRALGTLLRFFQDNPRSINASSIRTVTHTVDFLSPLLEASVPSPAARCCSPLILVVDDETSLITLVCAALYQAGLRALGADDPDVALKLLRLNAVDLVFLDVAMPAMDGFAVCTQLRALPLHKRTPVVFLTGLADFENRARSILQGGNDLIGKPFLAAELIVKALTYVFQSQLETANKPSG